MPKDRWKTLLGRLSTRSRQALGLSRPETADPFTSWTSRLKSPAATKLQIAPAIEVEPLAPQWFLVVMADGEPPSISALADADEVAGALAELDGEDCYAYVLLGHRFFFSKAPHRFFVAGDVFPLFEIPGAEIEVNTSELSMQDDGFLGGEELRVVPTSRPPKPEEDREVDLSVDGVEDTFDDVEDSEEDDDQTGDEFPVET